MLAVKLLDGAGITADALRRHGELHLAEPFGDVWISHQNFSKLRARFAGMTREKFRRGHDARAGLAVGKRNDPNPRARRMDARPDFSAFASRRTLVAGDVREQRLARRKSRRLFQI